MTKHNEQFKLTNREIDIMNILWSAGKPLVASDIHKLDSSISLNTIQAVLRGLLNKKLIKIADIVYSGTVLTRSYRPTISSHDFSMQGFVNQIKDFGKNISTPSIVATLLEYENNESDVIEQLENMLQERKKQLKEREE